MNLAKVRKTLKELLRNENVKIARQPRNLHASNVRVRCATRERGRIARLIRAAGLYVLPVISRSCIDVTELD